MVPICVPSDGVDHRNPHVLVDGAAARAVDRGRDHCAAAIGGQLRVRRVCCLAGEGEGGAGLGAGHGVHHRYAGGMGAAGCRVGARGGDHGAAGGDIHQDARKAPPARVRVVPVWVPVAGLTTATRVVNVTGG